MPDIRRGTRKKYNKKRRSTTLLSIKKQSDPDQFLISTFAVSLIKRLTIAYFVCRTNTSLLIKVSKISIIVDGCWKKTNSRQLPVLIFIMCSIQDEGV